MAANHDFLCDQGATFEKVITWLDSQGVPVPLGAYTARMQVRDEADSSTAAISLTTENSRITLGGAAGTITLLISATDTAAITAGEYVYDLELVGAGGYVYRLIQGCFTVDAEVTR